MESDTLADLWEARVGHSVPLTLQKRMPYCNFVVVGLGDYLQHFGPLEMSLFRVSKYYRNVAMVCALSWAWLKKISASRTP